VVQPREYAQCCCYDALTDAPRNVPKQVNAVEIFRAKEALRRQGNTKHAAVTEAEASA